MKFRIISDVHSEFNSNHDRLDQIPAHELDKESVLIIAGDYCVFYKNKFDTISVLSSRFYSVIYVPGNHEYYKGSFPYSEQKFIKYITDNNLTNVHLLQNKTLQIDDIIIYGSTLWTRIDYSFYCDIVNRMNDYKKIRSGNYHNNYANRFVPVICDEYFNKSISKLKTTIDSITTQKLLVVTHHAPTELSIADEFINSPVTSAYYTELFLNDKYLDDSYRNKITVWVHGHTHNCVDTMINNTRIICNPCGYPDQNTHFDKYKFIEL